MFRLLRYPIDVDFDNRKNRQGREGIGLSSALLTLFFHVALSRLLLITSRHLLLPKFESGDYRMFPSSRRICNLVLRRKDGDGKVGKLLMMSPETATFLTIVPRIRVQDNKSRSSRGAFRRATLKAERVRRPRAELCNPLPGGPGPLMALGSS